MKIVMFKTKSMAMTDQELFDKTVDFMLNQKRLYCCYKHNELCCAVGCHLNDDEYDPNMEGSSIYFLIRKGKFPERLLPYADFLVKLQTDNDKAWAHTYDKYRSPIDHKIGLLRFFCYISDRDRYLGINVSRAIWAMEQLL